MLTQSFFRAHLSKIAGTCLLAGVLAVGLSQSAPVVASDHDDGETNIKARNLNLTDLFVFREDWHSNAAADSDRLCFIMCTNPRSLARQQYFFNTFARYTFHVTRNATRDTAATGREDVRFEFTFGAPSNNAQPITLNIVRNANGQEVNRETFNVGNTTPAPPLLGAAPDAPVTNTVNSAGGAIRVFAGLRADPFFFDVDTFFRTRAAVANNLQITGPTPVGRPATFLQSTLDNSVDFAKGYNVNAIVMSVPVSVLRAGGGNETVFDVWETISIPTEIAGHQ